MKLNKFFAVLMAGVMALGMTACGGDKDNDDPKDPTPSGELTVTPMTAEIEVGATVTLTASAEDVAWSAVSSTQSVVLDKTTGKAVVVTGKAAGKASVIATKGDKQVIITITVKGKEGGGDGKLTIDATEIYPIFLDQEVYDANASKIKSDFRPDETAGKNLYIWAAGETYNAGDGSGKSYFGLTNGYTSLTVAAPNGWSGGGLNLSADYASQVNALIAKIKAEPDKYYLHIGIKSTDNAVHKFYIFADASAYIVLGATAFVDQGVSYAPFADFTRNGAWQGVDFPVSKYATQLTDAPAADGRDIFSFLSGATVGAQLNLDAVYFYKK